MTNKNETKRFHTLQEVQIYIDSLDATDTTKIYTVDVRNTIDSPFKPLEKELSAEDKNIMCNIVCWLNQCITFETGEKEITYNLLTSFNEYSNMRLSSRKFIPILVSICKSNGNHVVKTKARVNGKPESVIMDIKLIKEDLK